MTSRDPREPAPRKRRSSLLWAPLATALLLHAGTPADAQGIRLVLPQGRVLATEQFEWFFSIQVVNDLDTGIYIDSLTCNWTDLGAGVTRDTRTRAGTFPQIAQVIRSVSGRDSAIAHYRGPALAEHARLSFLVKAHDGEGRTHQANGELEIQPGMVSVHFPSRFLETKTGRVEYVMVPEVWPGDRPSPAILLVHGEGSHGRQLLPWAWDLANRGYAAMVVSMPGYGLSTGEPDFAGPATLNALDQALETLRRSPGVDSNRVALWGVSRGATAAALLAEKQKDLKGLVLQSGLYDLGSAFESTSSEELRAAIQREAGKKGEGWKRRSPRHAFRRLMSPVLLIHGERDDVVPAAQANDLAAALRVAGRPVTLELVPEAGHFLSGPAITKPALDFLQQHLHPIP